MDVTSEKPPGIIPTRMGTSLLMLVYALLTEDHPHAYGDKNWSANTVFGIVGSSPRVWGQEAAQHIKPVGIGIIPTRMGTSHSEFRENPLSQDHPHAYGDKPHGDIRNISLIGSSPRVWGQAPPVR